MSNQKLRWVVAHGSPGNFVQKYSCNFSKAPHILIPQQCLDPNALSPKYVIASIISNMNDFISF